MAYDNSPDHSPLPASTPTPEVPAMTLGLIHCAAMSKHTEVDMNLPITPNATHPGPPWFRAADTIRHPSF